MTDVLTRGADCVVNALIDSGIDTIFGVPGQHALALFDAVNGSSLRFIGCRHELAAAFAADGYSRGRATLPGLFLSTGPGTLVALAGLQEARESCAAAVAIVTDVERQTGRRRMSQLHELADQATIVRGVVKAALRVEQTDAIPSSIAEAAALARTPPMGPVAVQIPCDLLAARAAEPTMHRRPRPQMHGFAEVDADTAMLVKELNDALRPIILVGGGVAIAGVGDEVIGLAESLAAPMVSTFAGKGSVPWDHSLHVGSWLEAPAVRGLIEDADLVLALGCGLGELTTTNCALRPRRTIQVDADPARLTNGENQLGLEAELETVLPDLSHLVRHRDDQAREVSAERVRGCRKDTANWLEQRGLLQEIRLLSQIRAALPADGVSAWDMTILGYWAWNAFPVEPHGRFLSAQGAGGLGYALPAAIGAAIAEPARPTLAVCGDGGLPYAASELATAAQHDARVALLVIDDGGYGVLGYYQDHRFGRRTAVRLPGPDITALASAHSIPSRRTTPETIEADLGWALAHEGPAVVALGTNLQMF
jgi:acetolactate synthase-1/2/3 large subunit